MLVTLELDEIAEIFDKNITRQLAPILSTIESIRSSLDDANAKIREFEKENKFDTLSSNVSTLISRVDNFPIPKDGVDGVNGVDGKSVALEEVLPPLLDYLTRYVEDIKASIPEVRDGVDGKDGIDGKNGVDGKDGADGKDGVDGVNGKDGIDGTSFTADEVVPMLKGYIDQELAKIEPIVGRDGKDGVDGVDGKDGVNGTDGANGSDGADGRDGVDGTDGQSVFAEDIIPSIVEDILPLLKEYVVNEVSKIEPVRGKDGVDGKSVVVDEFVPIISELVDDRFKSIRVPVDGRDGVDGVDGKDGRDGVNGKDGHDGLGSAGAMIDRDGNLFITFTNGETRSLGVVVGKDGKDADTNVVLEQMGKEIDRRCIELPEIVKTVVDAATFDLGKMVLQEVETRVVDIVQSKVETIVSTIPVPKDGRDGSDGVNVDYEVVEKIIEDKFSRIAPTIPTIEEILSNIPVPKDGIDGVSPSIDEINAFVEKSVEKLPRIVSAVIDRKGCLVLNMSDGLTQELGLVVGRDGKDGIDGGIVEKVVSSDEEMPDDLSVKVAKAVNVLAESSTTTIPTPSIQTPIVLNIQQPTAPIPVSKRITTRRDENGNIVAEVTET